jgi:hypothetical protein
MLGNATAALVVAAKAPAVSKIPVRNPLRSMTASFNPAQRREINAV